MKMNLPSLVVLVALVSLSALAFAAPGYNPRGLELRELSPEKRLAVERIMESHQERIYELREQIWARQTELQALSAAGIAGRSDIQGLVGDLSSLRMALRQERQAIRSEIERETGVNRFGLRAEEDSLGADYLGPSFENALDGY